VAPRLRVITYNIRKGKGASGRSTAGVDALGRALSGLAPDVVLCQEVFVGHGAAAPQTQVLADLLGLSLLYEPNRQRKHGHHGNATYSRHPVSDVRNYDVSTNRIERRGVLYARLSVGGQVVHVLNAHLGLNSWQRLAQVKSIGEILREQTKAHEPVLLAGDFNDWHGRLDHVITEQLGLTNAFADVPARRLSTWHAARPLFNLDRVYVRNLAPRDAHRLDGKPWHGLSDHLPLWVELELGAVACAA